jgi:uncharacterized protein YcbX
MGHLRIPLAKPDSGAGFLSRILGQSEQRQLVDPTVWDWAGQALDEGNDAAAWFWDYLKRPCRLVSFAPGEDHCGGSGRRCFL